MKSPSIDNVLLASITTAKIVPATHLPTFWFEGQREKGIHCKPARASVVRGFLSLILSIRLSMIVYKHNFLQRSLYDFLKSNPLSWCQIPNIGLFHHLLFFIFPKGGFPCSSVSKESACNAGDLGSVLGLGRSPGEGNGNPLQYSCLENLHGQRSLEGSSPRGHKSRTRLSN